MNTAVYSFITKHSLISYGDTIIIGLSGGPDSVFLLHMLHGLRSTLSLNLVAAHLNHEWRDDAYEDVIFCKNLCYSLDISFESASAQDFALKISKKGSKEEQGRILRRAFFESMKKKYNAATIALGHHQDDQIETFFIRLIRGASLEGLCSIRPSHNGYIRPLLETSKQAILNYLDQNNIAYQLDSTNNSSLFLRNRLRTALPLLNECDTRFVKNTFKAIEHIQEVHFEIKKIIAKKYLLIVSNLYAVRWLNVDLLRKETNYFQKQIVGRWLNDHEIHSLSTISNRFIDEIIRFLLKSKGGTHRLHPTWTIIKKKNMAIIKKTQSLNK